LIQRNLAKRVSVLWNGLELHRDLVLRGRKDITDKNGLEALKYKEFE